MHLDRFMHFSQKVAGVTLQTECTLISVLLDDSLVTKHTNNSIYRGVEIPKSS